MIKVVDVYQQITLEPYLIDQSESLSKVLTTFKRINPVHRSLYVVNTEKRMIGIITLREIFNIYAIRNGFAKVDRFTKVRLLDYLVKDSTAEKIMRKGISVMPEDSISHVIQLMIQEDLHELPVVNGKGIVTGDLNIHEILRNENGGILSLNKVVNN